MNLYEAIEGKLIVSCQALPDEPLHGAHIMAQMAVAVSIGGAAAIRANGPDDIRAIREAVNLPIIGLYKDGDTGVYITPTFRHAQEISEAGADAIALDATARPRPDGSTINELFKQIHTQLGKPIIADVSTLEEGIAAEAAGAEFVASTLSGYTDYSPQESGPDVKLIAALAKNLSVPVIAEGKIHTPEDALRAFEAGAFSVVVGSAITRPRTITARFVDAIEKRRRQS